MPPTTDRESSSKKINFVHSLDAVACPGSRELRPVKIPTSYDARRPPKRRKNDSIKTRFFLVSEISFSSFTDHRHLRTIVQDARTQYRSNRNEYRIDRIEKTQNASFGGIKPNVLGFFRIGFESDSKESRDSRLNSFKNSIFHFCHF